MIPTLHSFTPIVAEGCRVLILGTMPGEESLRRGQYYGHPRNAFWPIMARICSTELADTYAERTRMLTDAGIALWDVCGTCERTGSLDSAIRREIPNPIDRLLAEHPTIETVCFNGQGAARLFKKHFATLAASLHTLTLPSTSPTHAIVFERKLAEWMAIGELLH